MPAAPEDADGRGRHGTQPGSYDAEVVSKHPLDQAKSARDQAQSQLQARQAHVGQETVRLHYYRVTAPGAGIVGDIPVQIRFDFNRCRLDFLS